MLYNANIVGLAAVWVYVLGPRCAQMRQKALESNDAGSVLLVENVENASRVDCVMQQSECKELLLLL